MSMTVTSTNPDFAKSVCAGSAKLVAISGAACPADVTSLTTVDGEIIASITTTGQGVDAMIFKLFSPKKIWRFSIKKLLFCAKK
jgi:hypothetical protein